MINLCKNCKYNICNRCYAHDTKEHLPEGYVDRCDYFEYEAPKVSRWNYDGNNITCQLCGCTLIKANHPYSYCPDCGAEMIFEVL